MPLDQVDLALVAGGDVCEGDLAVDALGNELAGALGGRLAAGIESSSVTRKSYIEISRDQYSFAWEAIVERSKP